MDMSGVNSAILFTALSALIACIVAIWRLFSECDKKLDDYEDSLDDWWQYFPQDEDEYDDEEVDAERESKGSER